MMCGIAGIFHPDPEKPVSADILWRMTTTLEHRGPDGEGFHIEPGIGFGHRRLAIIDLEGGRQPMFNEDGSVVVVFNGEIYNHLSVRRQLEADGHTFHSKSDTEAIVHAWENWGPQCLQRLSGQFAFALWDRNRQQLFLARDRLGEKPLYYSRLFDGTLIFGSELQTLLTHPLVPRNLSPAAIDDYFTFGYVPDPNSIYESVSKIPAGHYLLLHRGVTASIAPQCYWSPHFAPRFSSEEDAAFELRERLDRCVAACLIADVPLGAFLSGGVDSSAVVSSMAGLKSDPITAFTIGFAGEDETPFAKSIADRYGAAHITEFDVALDYIDAARAQAKLFGEPFADSSSVPTHRLAIMARQHVTVALSGDGGDELFGGYRRYRWYRIAEAVRRSLPNGARRQLFAGLARIYPKLDRAPRWLRARATLTEISLDAALGYYRTLCKVHDEQRRQLFAPQFVKAIDGHDPSRRIVDLMEESDTDDPVSQAQYVDLKSYLAGDILTKVDRASMATSLEVRTPLLDHDFVEWAMTLPSALKLRSGEGKYILRRAVEGRVPAACLYRTKQGFAANLADRFRKDGVSRVRDRLLGEGMLGAGIFDGDALNRLIEAHASGHADYSAALWSLLVFEGFLQRGAAGREMPMTGSGRALEFADERTRASWL
jgi:asparagine synthase (glutamine-hydrolysing)